MFNRQRENRNKRRDNSDKLRIIPVGGLEFIGANCTAIQYGNDIMVIDAGIGFPNADQHGVDCLIPNPKFLKKNAGKIKGLVISHGHLDHIGAIPYLIEEMGNPTIYASKFARELILINLKDNFRELYTKVNIETIDINSDLQFGKLDVSFFGVNHSIPESMGLIIRTDKGTIVHSGDFKFDNSPVNEPIAEYAKLANVGAEGVLCLLSDSTNSYKEGHSLSESEISVELENLIEEIPGRIIVATFGSMVNRLIELLKIAEKHNRKVFISGRSMKNAIKIAIKTGYVKLPENLFVKAKNLGSLKDENIMILSTGSQGEDLAALSRMARNEHNDIKLKKGDSVIMSASVIPGNGAVIQSLIDKLSKQGASVYHNEIMNLHTTGHGHKEEQKLMINLVQPKYFMPVHGFQSFLTEHAKTAMKLGIREEDIILGNDGDVIELNRDSWKIVEKLQTKPVIVSGSVVGDVGETVLDDRQQLANFGVFVFTMLVDKNTKKLIKRPIITSRGFVYMKHSKEMMDATMKLIEVEYERLKNNPVNEIKEGITKKLRRHLYGLTEREPMLLSVVTYL